MKIWTNLKNAEKYKKNQKIITLKIMIVETSGWHHLKEENQLLAINFISRFAQKMYQLPKMAQAKKGNPKSYAGLKKPTELRFFDFFPNYLSNLLTLLDNLLTS